MALAVATGMPGPARAAEPVERHRVVLWTFDEDVLRRGFHDAVRALGADAVSVNWHRDPGPIERAELGWYADHAAAKGTLGLLEEVWRPAWDRFEAARTQAWPALDVRARPKCLRDPALLEEMAKNTERAAQRAKGRAFALSLDDEPSAAVRANPVDWCLCDRCVAEFRDGARRRHATVAALNAAWGTDYRKWDEVRPWTTAAIRARAYAGPAGGWNLAPWMETRAFQDETFERALAHLARVSRAAAPGLQCGITGAQAPGAFGGWDYRRLGAVCDFLEPYDIGLALPVARDLAPPGAVIAQTVFPSGEDTCLPRWRLWRGIARGANTTIVWSSRDALKWDERGQGTPTRYGEALAAELALLSRKGGLGDRLARARPLDEGIVVVLSQPSLSVRWMLDSREDGDTWPRRFGSHEARASSAIASREAAWRALAGRGRRFVDARELTAAALKDVRLVVLPDVLCLSDAEAAALSAFAARGGRIVADRAPGEFDELGRARRAPALAARGVDLDPGLAALGAAATAACGAPPGRAVAKRADGEPAPAVELGLSRDGDALYVVAVPAWDVRTGDGGETEGQVPACDLEITFETGDGRPRGVRDERAARELGRVARWTATCDAAGGLVWRVR